MSEPIVIVGAGLAGLTCARRLLSSGHRVLLLDRDDRPGGRMKTDVVDGFRIDRGFQVYFTAYPNAKRELDREKLQLRPFSAGALVLWDGRLRAVRRDDTVQMLFSDFFGLADKLRVAAWNAEVAGMSYADIWAMEDGPSEEAFLEQGLSRRFVDRFARPFFGGVFLDRSLAVSRRMMTFVWKMLLEGETTVPALGIEEVPKQVAASIPAEKMRFGVDVVGLLRSGGRVSGVRLANGEEVAASAVVVATEGPAAAALSGQPAPTRTLSSTTVTFAAKDRPTDEPILILNGNFPGQVNHVAVMSNVSKDLAPSGVHLVSATLLGMHRDADAKLAGDVRYELAQWFPKTDARSWRPLKVDRVEHAQLVQEPGILDSLPSNTTPVEGLFLAGEYTTNSSIDGAVQSGIACATAVMSRSAAVAG